MRRGRWRVLLLAPVLWVGGGCYRLTVPEAPGPLPPPLVNVAEPVLVEESPVVEAPAMKAAPTDPIVGSRWAAAPGFVEEVDGWVGFWTGREGGAFPTYLKRMAGYAWFVDEALERKGLPSSLRYLPIIESGYSPGAVSRASAVGLWQLMAPTARAGGMRVGALVDERRDPIRSTEVATDYLAYLYGRFGSWFLALAAYNGGPSRVDGLLDRYAPGAPPSDSLFFVIRSALPRETRDFVPRFLAAARVATNAAGHGLGTGAAAARWEYDEVVVPDATSLDVVARAAGVGEPEVRAMNPHVLRGVTPEGAATTLRLPPGRGALFELAYARIPEDERVTVTEHVVARGDTLWGIARRYGIELGVLEEANPSVRPDRIRPGDRLVVPLLPGGGSGG